MNAILPEHSPIPALLPAAWLAQHLHDPQLGVIAILSRHPQDGGATVAVEGAHAFHWKELLWDERQRQFVGANTLRRRLRAAGVDPDRHLVLYGDHSQFGFYARWVLLRAGLHNVSVLDGGLRAWRASELPVIPLSTVHTPLPPADGDLQPPAHAQDDIRASRDQLLQRLGDDSLQILDIRTQEEYDGQRVGPDGGNHGAERAGHIPGARLFPFASLLDEHSRLLPVASLRALADAAGLDAQRETVVYCRLSHRSTLAFFALTELLGFSKVRVYDGSWTEWGSLVGAPIAY
jgi:thiosulfate/3-mercaptopyruvate sulfurtransferase